MSFRRILAVLLAASTLVAACGGDDDDSDDATDDTVAEETESTDDTEPADDDAADETETEDEASEDADEDAGEDAAPGTAIEIGETVTDDILGHEITFVSVVRDFPIPEGASAIADRGDELVLVEVEITAGSEYYAGVYSSSFTWGVGDEDYSGQSAGGDDVIAAMEAAGYTPLEDVSRGETGTGWISGYLNPADSDEAFVAYRRVAAQGSDGTDIPEQSWPVTLPLG